MFILTTFNACLMVLLLSYAFYRLIKTKKAVTLVSFTIQLSAVTIVILSLVNHVNTSNSVGLFYITFGILIPSYFVFQDYRCIVKRSWDKEKYDIAENVIPQIGGPSEYVNGNNIEIMSVQSNDSFIDETILEFNLLKNELFLGLKKRLVQAEKSYNQQNYDNAYEIYKGLLVFIKTSGNLFFNYGNVCFKKGLFNEAIVQYRKTLEQNQLIISTINKSELSLNSYSDVINNIRFKEYLVYLNIGITYFNFGKTDLALENFYKALEINHECLSAKEGIGRVYAETGKKSDAINYFKEIIQKDGKNYEISILLGKLLVEEGNTDQAREFFESCIKNNPQLPDAYMELGRLFVTQSKYSEAKKVYKTYITINDDDYIGHYNFAECYYQNKEYENAITEYQRVISLNQRSHESLFRLGMIYDERDEYEKAVDCYKAVIQMKPEFIDAYNNLGIVFSRNQRHVEALAAYTGGIKASPDSFRLHYNMGVVLFDIKSYEDAADAFSRAIELNPEDKDVYYYLGASFTELKQYDAAIKAYGRALDDKMGEGELYYNIAAVYALMKKQDIVIDNLKKALSKDSAIKQEICQNNVFDYMRTNSDFVELVS